MPKKQSDGTASTRASEGTTWRTLEEFMRAPRNSVSRESILTRRALYDLAIAAAHGGYALQVFTPDVDRDGVDLVLSDADSTVPVQLKASVNPVKSSSRFENIHAGVLRPHLDVAEHLGFECTQSGTGQAGAVIAIDVTLVPPSPDDESAPPLVDLRYWVTSAEILVALSKGYVGGAPHDSPQAVTELIHELQQSRANGRVNVKGCCFVPAASPGAILTLLGLHSHDPYQSCYQWGYNLHQALKRPTVDEEAQFKREAAWVPGQIAADVERKHKDAHADLVMEAFQACVRWPNGNEA